MYLEMVRLSSGAVRLEMNTENETESSTCPNPFQQD